MKGASKALEIFHPSTETIRSKGDFRRRCMNCGRLTGFPGTQHTTYSYMNGEAGYCESWYQREDRTWALQYRTGTVHAV